MTYEIHDREGDRLRLTLDEEDSILTVLEKGRAASVYLSREDARLLRDHLDEFLGGDRKASPETLDEAKALLVGAAKDLLRKAAPVDGDLVVFLEPSS